jgi:hypothetical protein
MSTNPIINTFDDYYNSRCENVFKNSKDMEILSSSELFKIYDNSPELLKNFLKLKNPPDLPEINENFKNYFRENLEIGVGRKHSPISYSTEEGKNSCSYASPEIQKKVWINMKTSIVWYNQFIKDGYYIDA